MTPGITLLIVLASAGALAGVVLFLSFRAAAGRQLAEAREEAEAILSDASSRARRQSGEILLEAGEKADRLREEAAREAERRSGEMAEAERALEAREVEVTKREEECETVQDEVRRLREEAEQTIARASADAEAAETARVEQTRRLESLAGLTADQARDMLLEAAESEARSDASRLISRVQARARQEASESARQVILSALGRVTGRDVLDPVVTMVRLPGDDMKGRIIGREGRNIRTLELNTGVDVIIDNTPGIILLSAWDPIRREVARVALERLIEDGRIHPARIEEVVEKVREEIEEMIQQAGEAAAYEMGIPDMNSRLLRLLGGLRYRTARGYNMLLHCLETSLLAGHMAAEMSARERVARRAALLHAVSWADDVQKGGHWATASAEIAARHGESDAVVAAIAALAPGGEAKTAEAILVRVAKRIADARPGARRENLAAFIERMHHLEKIAGAFPGVKSAYALKGGREMRVLVASDGTTDEEAVMLSRDIARKIESTADYAGEIKVSVIRETRAVDYAV